MYPGTSFLILKICVWLTLISNLASFITMLLRIILVTDFKIVKVTIKSKEGESSRQSSDYKIINAKEDDGKETEQIS